MSNEELIMQRLDSIESKLSPLADSIKSMNELKEDITPLANNAVQLLIKELEDVESGFQLEDLMEMFKQMLRSVRNITYSLKQLESIIDFVTTLEPLLRSSVPQIISYLDELEQRGVFRIINATLGVRAKIAEAYSPEDIEKIGDGLVALLGLAKKITDPQALEFLEKVAEVPAQIDLASSKELGPFGLLWASSSKEVKVGLGVLIELTKGMGRLKTSTASGDAPSESSA
ncbi:MAG: DUF1641 domain-containing protein [Deltaproteobacteria bacterium]|nr:DUF1641 domain-containing protein [Deltaproteobacteria bacterium]